MNKNILPKIVFPNKPEEEMLIGAYVEPLIYGRYIKDHDVKVDANTAFDDLKNANFNTLLQTESQLNREDNEVTLTMFRELHKRKMSFLFRDNNVVGDKNMVTQIPDEELKEYFEKAYKSLTEYSSFAGIHYIDEPGWKDWKRAREIKRVFKSVFPDKLFFTNLLQVYAPDWAFPNGPIYMPNEWWWKKPENDCVKYYESYLNEAEPEVFSYDYYPLRYEFPYLLDQYFLQLHLSYKYSKKANLPLICFVQNGIWDTSGRVPNEGELRWQVNTALAYNTKGICYFTYWCAAPVYKKMCIHESGEKTTNYYLVQQINKELLFLDEYILNADFKGYMLFGKTPNNETPVKEDEITSFGNIKGVSGGDLFIGCFDYYKEDKRYNMYIVVNNSISERLNETLYFNEEMSYTVLHRDSKEKRFGDKMELNLPQGDAYIIIENL